MARKKKGPKVPGYLHHKASGRAFVIIAGKRVYLGKHGTPESKAQYERVIAEYLANGRQAVVGAENPIACSWSAFHATLA